MVMTLGYGLSYVTDERCVRYYDYGVRRIPDGVGAKKSPNTLRQRIPDQPLGIVDF